jgi:hypothetical protein
MINGSPWLALVALDEERLPSADAVATELAARFPDAAPLEATSQTERSVTFKCDQATGNYTLVDKPIPWERLEGPCATAWYWPEAEQAMRRHTAHLLVTLLDESKDPIDTAILMTRLVTALASQSSAVGIVWGPSGQVHRPEDFAAMATRMAREDLPLHLWIDFRVTQLEDEEGLALFTTGLEALGHREFETPQFAGDAEGLAGTVYNVTHYVLEKGAVLKDGEAVGLPDGSQVNIQFGPSMIDESQEVIQLRFE